MNEDHEAEGLRAQQRERAAREQRLAHRAPEEDEAEQHQRRAEKADYLQEKLAERVDSERENDS